LPKVVNANRILENECKITMKEAMSKKKLLVIRNGNIKQEGVHASNTFPTKLNTACSRSFKTNSMF
jgi:hypothetical protein